MDLLTLTYFTVRVDAQGKVHYRRDIYGRDKKLSKGLEKGPAAGLTKPAGGEEKIRG